MEKSRTFKGRPSSSTTKRDRDRQQSALVAGRVAVHGTVPGSGTMRRAGEVFAMRSVTGDGRTYEER